MSPWERDSIERTCGRLRLSHDLRDILQIMHEQYARDAEVAEDQTLKHRRRLEAHILLQAHTDLTKGRAMLGRKR